jgi:glutaredoxin
MKGNTMKVAVYSKDSCPYCVKAINLLETTDLEFTEYKLDKDFGREEILEWFPGANTFPIIPLDNMWIGGYNQLVEVVDEWKKED